MNFKLIAIVVANADEGNTTHEQRTVRLIPEVEAFSMTPRAAQLEALSFARRNGFEYAGVQVKPTAQVTLH